MKTIYDLRINSRGNCEPMADGHFKYCAETANGNRGYVEDDYKLIECPRCIYRVPKYDLETADYRKAAYEKYIRRAMAMTEE